MHALLFAAALLAASNESASPEAAVGAADRHEAGGLAIKATKILTCAWEGPQVVDHGVLLVREAGGWTSDFLTGDAMTVGNMAAAAAPGMIDEIKTISGLERSGSNRPTPQHAEL